MTGVLPISNDLTRETLYWQDVHMSDIPFAEDDVTESLSSDLELPDFMMGNFVNTIHSLHGAVLS
jgi:hypothetical protein